MITDGSKPRMGTLPAALRLLVCLCLLDAGGIALAQTKPDGELTRLAEGVYAEISNPNGSAVSNAGVVVLDRSVLVFDTHFTPEAGQALAARILAITAKRVRFVVNSHFHSDHTHGNQAMPRTADFIASTNTRRDVLQKDLPTMNRMIGIAQSQADKLQKDLLKETDPAQKEVLRRQLNSRTEFVGRMSRDRIVAPTVTFDDTLVIEEGSREVRLLYLGTAHTDGDAVMLLPAERIAFVGDLFFNACFPTTQDASLLEWIKTLGELLKLDADKFVPGHGPPGDKKDVRNFLSYLEELRTLVEPAVARGDSLEQVVQATQIPARFSSFGFANFFPANVQKMYEELKAAQIAAGEAQPADQPKKTEPDKPQP